MEPTDKNDSTEPYKTRIPTGKEDAMIQGPQSTNKEVHQEVEPKMDSQRKHNLQEQEKRVPRNPYLLVQLAMRKYQTHDKRRVQSAQHTSKEKTIETIQSSAPPTDTHEKEGSNVNVTQIVSDLKEIFEQKRVGKENMKMKDSSENDVGQIATALHSEKNETVLEERTGATASSNLSSFTSNAESGTLEPQSSTAQTMKCSHSPVQNKELEVSKSK
ncbi:hypothetical protein EJB05_09422 [Eragrostis curvula]|uniref:Uncharacterized protein n=1 Tax=Eragrostis curvula TaxID=38414 RepID=A0A5J9W4Z4_9POAL|nr:hypothetical protein EJB05_09422 [Eragrostis curvula]